MNKTILHLLLACLLVQAPATAAERPTSAAPGFAGKPAAKSPHIALLRTDRGCAVYQVPSGRYEFRAAL